MAYRVKLKRAFSLSLLAPLIASAPMVISDNDDSIDDADQPPALSVVARNKRILAIGRALDEFRLLSPTMPVAQIQAFLLVAIDERIGMTDVAELTGVKPSTASRYLLDLGVARTALDNAYDLLDRGVDPMNTRKARYTLTRKGKALVSRLVDSLAVAFED